MSKSKVKKKKEKYKLIYLEWCDAITRMESWSTQKEALVWGEKSSWVIKQTGWLIKQTKKYILLSMKYTPEDDDSAEMHGIILKIPTTWIIRRVDLTKHI